MNEIREVATRIISTCYSKKGSTCKLHPIFQPQKFLNKLFSGEIQTDTHRIAIVKKQE